MSKVKNTDFKIVETDKELQRDKNSREKLVCVSAVAKEEGMLFVEQPKRQGSQGADKLDVKKLSYTPDWYVVGAESIGPANVNEEHEISPRGFDSLEYIPRSIDVDTNHGSATVVDYTGFEPGDMVRVSFMDAHGDWFAIDQFTVPQPLYS